MKTAAKAVFDAEESLREQVSALRARGVSWARIAKALGVSRQAAWERFSTSSNSSTSSTSSSTSSG